MAEITDWSPVDDNNNMAPPVGWPEGMMPSAVNNTARGMMGTLRRAWDRIVAGTEVLPYLPLAGGTVTGNVAVNGTGGVSLQTTVLRNISGGLEVTNPAGGAIVSRGPGAHLGFGDRDQTSPGWIWYAQSGVAALWNGSNRISVDTAGNTNVGGNFGSPGNITANGQVAGSLVTSSGNITANLDVSGRDVSASRNIWASGGTVTATQLTSTANITASGTATAAQLTSTGNINASVDIAAVRDVYAGRNVSVTGTVLAPVVDCSGRINAAFYDCDGYRVIDTSSGAPTFYKGGGATGIMLINGSSYYDNDTHVFRNSSTSNTFTIDVSGNVNAIGNVTANSGVSASTNLYAGGSVDGAYVQSRGDASIAGTLTVPRINMSGRLQTSNWIVPAADNGSNVGLPGLNFNSMHAYAFVVPSDAKLKADVETPRGCLEVVQATAPRTYRLPGAPDPDSRHWGLLAQEVGAAMQAAGCDYGVRRVDKESGEEGLALNELVAVLWGACREMAARLESLEGEKV